MTYLVLARKYRPRTFEEVVGQSHVTKTLANAIESGRVGHAYLFSGPRGVGKTTTARLLAKSLNCPNAKGAVACNKCDVCKEITNGTSLDVIEIDAASNRGIDEIRNLRENVKYAPAGGKYKVYVVDEVHMLTDAAFNALLKTLEEPPVHVKFILATTAPLKVPETILSRCQRFEFVRIASDSIFTRIKDISLKEGFEVADEVLRMLSRRANGSLRDAESMLDQLVSAGLQGTDESAVTRLLGLSGAENFFSIMDSVKAGNAGQALKTLGELFDKGTNLDEFADGFLEHLRNLLLIKIHTDLASLVEASAGHVKRYKEQAKQFTEGDLLRLINLASKAAFSVRRSELPRLHLETAIVEMAYLDSMVQVSELLERLARLETSFGGGDLPEAGPKEPEPVGADETSSSAEETSPPEDTKKSPASEALSELAAGSALDSPAPEAARREPETTLEVPEADRARWREILTRLNTRKKALGVCLSAARFLGISQGKVIIGFGQEQSFEHSFADNKENRNLLKQELADVFKLALGISFTKIESEPSEAAEELEPQELEELDVPSEETSPRGSKSPQGRKAAPGGEASGKERASRGKDESGEAAVPESGGKEKGSKRDDSVRTIIDFFDGEIIEE